jgi:hypothetical protein
VRLARRKKKDIFQEVSRKQERGKKWSGKIPKKADLAVGAVKDLVDVKLALDGVVQPIARLTLRDERSPGHQVPLEHQPGQLGP